MLCCTAAAAASTDSPTLPFTHRSQVLEAGGSELAVAATAAALALADAGIEMFDLVSACSVVSSGLAGRMATGRWQALPAGRACCNHAAGVMKNSGSCPA